VIPRQRRRLAIARATIGLSLVALVLAGALGLVIIDQASSLIRPVTTTLRLTETVTSTGTLTTTVTSVSTQPITQVVPAGCSGGGNAVSGYWFGDLAVGTITSSAIICLQLYEFNATSPITVDPAGLIAISGVNSLISEQMVNGASNFTITSSSNSLELGGPTNANEGVVVALSVTAKPGASGTYWATVQQGYREVTAVPQGVQEGLYLAGNNGGGERDGPNGILVAGTGQPDYATNLGFSPVVLECTTSAFHIQGVAYNVCPDMLYYRVIAATNSTA
jgi:hypothetical protein